MADQSRPPVTGYPAAGGYPQQQSNANPNCYSTTAGTAYPYPAPPPQAAYYNPNPYYGQQPNATQRATFIRRLFSVLIASVIITGTVVFILWLILRPRLPEFRVDSVTLSNFNVSAASSVVTGNWDVRLTVRNPNHKMTLFYDRIQAHVFYRDELLAETAVPPFVQGTKNETTVRATFAASSAYVDRRFLDGINGDRSGGNVNFNLRMLARVRFKFGAWRARRRFVTVLCKDLSVGLSSNRSGGSLVGGSRQCRVGL